MLNLGHWHSKPGVLGSSEVIIGGRRDTSALLVLRRVVDQEARVSQCMLMHACRTADWMAELSKRPACA
jgi:hypothetical protein